MKRKIIKHLFAFAFGVWVMLAILSTTFFTFIKGLFFAIVCLVCWSICDWAYEDEPKEKDDE